MTGTALSHDAVHADYPRDLVITRSTTWSSDLEPRFYWRWLERWGVNSEHEYVLGNLEKDLATGRKGHTDTR